MRDIAAPSPNGSVPLYTGLCKLNARNSYDTHLRFQLKPFGSLVWFDIESDDHAFIEDITSSWGLDLILMEYNYSTTATILRGSVRSDGRKKRVLGFLPGEYHLVKEREVVSADLHIFNAIYRFDLPDSIEFSAGNWNIQMDRVKNFVENGRIFRETGGLVMTHVAKVNRVDQSAFALTELGDLSEILCDFLSFCYARKVTVNFINGFNTLGEVTQRFWRSASPSTYPLSRSWLPERADALQEMFQQFYAAWHAEKSFLRRILHWYLDCAAVDASIENALLLGQAALEAVFSKIFIEKKQIFLSGDAIEKVPASDRLRLLLDYLNVSFSIPITSKELVDAQGRFNWADAPHALTDIRNKIVHPRDIAKIESLAWQPLTQAVDLMRFYIELSVLRFIEYQGKFENRVGSGREPESVPWLA